MGAEDFAKRIAEGYATDGPAIVLGRGMHDGETYPDAVVQVPAAMMNRHGLIAGATGTGKTKSLQLLAEQLSALGVPVFAADVKGDLSGLTRPAEPNEKIEERNKTLGVDWTPAGYPVSFLSLGGLDAGVPVRATASSFGPLLLAKVLDANDTQRSSLSLVFHYAEENGLPLVDLADLRALLSYLTSDEGKDELRAIGGVSSATAGVLLRSITELEYQGGDAFFGEPAIAVADLMRTTDGKGVVSLLELTAVQDRPELFSTFLMWLLAELFRELPEEGDVDQPKLVFFFDEAHLLFDDASDELLDLVAQTVRLIRSKGVGVFFVTQLPDDVPDEVQAQLGNRIQHALRAHTPRDAEALRKAVTTYPTTEDYELAKALTELGTGEAVVTILSEKGAPSPVVWTKMLAPTSLMDTIGEPAIQEAATADPLWARYGERVDRESAKELLEKRTMTVKVEKPPEPEPEERPEPGERPEERPTSEKPKPRDDDNVVVDYLKSREGRQMFNRVVRGLGRLFRRRR
ncbi:MAG: helicase HerA-like domain-containing protein [Acidimicrobiales bacterium]